MARTDLLRPPGSTACARSQVGLARRPWPAVLEARVGSHTTPASARYYFFFFGVTFTVSTCEP